MDLYCALAVLSSATLRPIKPIEIITCNMLSLNEIWCHKKSLLETPEFLTIIEWPLLTLEAEFHWPASVLDCVVTCVSSTGGLHVGAGGPSSN